MQEETFTHAHLEICRSIVEINENLFCTIFRVYRIRYYCNFRSKIYDATIGMYFRNTAKYAAINLTAQMANLKSLYSSIFHARSLSSSKSF